LFWGNKSKTLIWFDMSCSEFQLSKKTDVLPVGRLLKGIKLSNHQAEKNTRLIVILIKDNYSI
jgi:hypothetical protein